MKYSLKSNFTQIPNDIFQAQTLSLKAIGLYAYLCYKSYCGNGEMAFPSQKKIMKELMIGSDHTLRKIIVELVDKKFLTVKRGSYFTGNSQYRTLIPKRCETTNIKGAE